MKQQSDGLILTLIAAMDENGLLARDGELPWDLPDEVQHFRSYTLNKWLLLGRKTYDQMTGWFREGHMPLVLSSRCGWDPKVGRVVSSVPHAQALAASASQIELVCIGGGQTFAAALPFADRLLLSTIHHCFPSGRTAVYFPPWEPSGWREVSVKHFPKGGVRAYAYSIACWERLKEDSLASSEAA